MKRIILFSGILFAVSSSLTVAHEVRPAYLELRQTGTETYDVLWKVPARGDNMRLGIYVEFPADTVKVTPPQTTFANDASTERWSVKRSGGLTGGQINISGLVATMTDVLVRVENLDHTTQVTRLTPSSPSFVVAAAPGLLEVIRTYLALGVEHILTGVDHLLFILALIIITYGGWKLVKTVTGFTVSHSITLTAATLGFVHVPQRPVEAVIALSIVFVACEVIHRRQGHPGLTERWPWIVALTFGLLHGLGFAGALSEIGLPPATSLWRSFSSASALKWANCSLSARCSSLLAIATYSVRSFRRSENQSPWSYQWYENIAAYAIGGVASFWLIERTLSFAS